MYLRLFYVLLIFQFYGIFLSNVMQMLSKRFLLLCSLRVCRHKKRVDLGNSLNEALRFHYFLLRGGVMRQLEMRFISKFSFTMSLQHHLISSHCEINYIARIIKIICRKFVYIFFRRNFFFRKKINKCIICCKLILIIFLQVKKIYPFVSLDGIE